MTECANCTSCKDQYVELQTIADRLTKIEKVTSRLDPLIELASQFLATPKGKLMTALQGRNRGTG